MKQTTKNILGVAAIALLSSGVAGYTTYQMLRAEKQPLSFADTFSTDSGAHLAAYVPAPGQPVDLTRAAESSLHAVVHIRSTQASKVQEVDVRDPFADFFGEFFGQRGGGTRRQQVQTPERKGFGSGVIISADGYIVTNNHVVSGADEIAVKLNDDREFKGRLIGTDPSTDLALVKIEGNDLPAIAVGNSDALRVGEWVLAVGNPFNLNSTVTAGIVSAKARSIGTESANGKAASIQSFIQTDAAINEGNSGGALVNAAGELVGINAMLYSPTGAYSGYSFAIPTSIMKKVVADLKQYGAVQRVLLGIKGSDFSTSLQMHEEAAGQMHEKAEQLGVKEGIWVAEVVDGGSAAGVLKVNDVITAINQKKIVKFAELQEALQQYRPGDKINVTVIRDKKEQTLQVTLRNEQGTTRTVKEADMEMLGAAFKPVSDDLKRQLGIGYGLQVTGVTQGKLMEAGIRKGFIILKVNSQPMHTTSDMENVMKAAARSTDAALFITGMFPSGKRAMFAVDLSQE